MYRFLILFSLGLVLNSSNLIAQNLSTEGTDFWFSFMDNWLQSSNNPIILEVYISANDTTQGILEIPLASGFQALEFMVVPQVTTRLTLPSEFAEAVGSKIIENKGVHVSTDKDVSIYAMNKRQYSADVAVILPTFSLSNNYLVLTHWETGNRNNNDNSDSEFLIVATEDNTEIEITPSFEIEGGGSPGIPFVINLNQGQTYEVQARGDLTGTKVVGVDNDNGRCNNFALYAGNQYTQVGSCDLRNGHDHLFAQMYPIKTWGLDYTVVDFETRVGGDLVKVLASEDNTIVLIGGEEVRLNEGDYVARTLEGINVIQADKPIAVGQFSRSQGCDDTRGDPFFIMLSPNKQLLRSITFNAPTIATVVNYSLNIIAPSSDISTIRFDGQPIGALFAPVPETPEISVARVITNSGNHTLFSEEGFIAYVYGYGSNESFGYSTGAGLANLSLSVDIENQDAVIIPVDSVCLHDQITFTPSTTSNFDSYFYDFGDGVTMEKVDQAAVVHQYKNVGSYIFKLTGLNVQDNCTGGNEESEIKIIKVINPALTVRGPRSICPNTSGVSYFVDNNIFFENEWFASGGTIVQSSNDSIKVDWGPTNSEANIKLVSHNRYNCHGDTVLFPVNINIKLEPEAPFGPDSLCVSNILAIRYDTYATPGSIYDWQIENGEVIDGQGSNEVAVNWFSAGYGKIWFDQMAQTDTICDGTSDTLLVYIQREPDPEVLIHSTKEEYQVEEPIVLTVTADTLFQLMRFFVNGELENDSLDLNIDLDFSFKCSGEYNFRIEVFDTVGICPNTAFAEHTVSVSPPISEIIRVTHDLDELNTLTIEWKVRQSDFKKDPFILERLEQSSWTSLDTLFEKSGGFIDSLLMTNENNYSYRVRDINECLLENTSRTHTSMLLKVDDSSTSNIALLNWTDYEDWSMGVEKYEIQLSVDSAEWLDIGTSEISEFEFQNDSSGFDYCFRIRAIEDQGNLSESYSNEACAFFIPELYPYNVITPNKDNKNESFVIKSIESYPNSRLIIFNRWGRVVLEQVAYQNNWQGTENGEVLPNGVYYYQLELNEPRVELKRINGVVSILK